MNAYEEKLEARRAYYERKAEEADAAGTAMWKEAHKMGEATPFGQPSKSCVMFYAVNEWDGESTGCRVQDVEKSLDWIDGGVY